MKKTFFEDAIKAPHEATRGAGKTPHLQKRIFLLEVPFVWKISYMAAGDAVGPAGLTGLVLLAVLLLLLLFLAVLILRNVKFRANSRSFRKQ
jgi:hypothetical protein